VHDDDASDDRTNTPRGYSHARNASSIGNSRLNWRRPATPLHVHAGNCKTPAAERFAALRYAYSCQAASVALYHAIR
jgi:hypothetical protein